MVWNYWRLLMRIYYFDDCDPNNEDHTLDICGKAFHNLIYSSMKYSSFFSVDYHIPYSINKEILDQLTNFEINDPMLIQKTMEQKSNHLIPPQHDFIRHYYWLNSVTNQLIFQLQDSLFNWELYSKYKMPENITLYRSDNTVFFTSITHEGFAYLYLRKNEDMSQIIDNQWSELLEE